MELVDFNNKPASEDIGRVGCDLRHMACYSRGLEGSTLFRKGGNHAPGDKGSHPLTTPLREPHISQMRICYPKC